MNLSLGVFHGPVQFHRPVVLTSLNVATNENGNVAVKTSLIFKTHGFLLLLSAFSETTSCDHTKKQSDAGKYRYAHPNSSVARRPGNAKAHLIQALRP